MNYTLMPSLEHIVLVSIAIRLWNEDDIRNLRARFQFDSFPPRGSLRMWRVTERRIIERISRLPNALKRKVLNFIKPICMEVVYWKQYHSENFGIPEPNNLCWTPQGTVDKKRTAEMLIRNENLDIKIRYKLACIYCLENDIPELWNRIPENERQSCYWEERQSYIEQLELVVFWTHNIKGTLRDMELIHRATWRSRNQYLFDSSVFRGNKAGAEYFLQKLTLNERRESLVQYTGTAAVRRCSSDLEFFDFPSQHYTEVLCFLLSQLDEEQQIEVFKRYPHEVLKCFLDWPWQSFFTETANRMRDYLTEENCIDLLNRMADNMIEEYKDYDYQILFGEFWKQLLTTHKMKVISECFAYPSRSLFKKLLDTGDKKNIRLIFKDAATLDGEDIISSEKVKGICVGLVCSGKWEHLKVFVQACTRKDTVIPFKEGFREHIRSSRPRQILYRERGMWNTFFRILDDIIHEHRIIRST